MFLKLYLLAIAVYIAIDLLWVGVIARDYYKKQLGTLMAETVNWPAIIIFYLLFTASLVVFVLVPGVANYTLLKTIGLGALFGLITYGTYDLINLGTTAGWPLHMTIVDMLWGTFVAPLSLGRCTWLQQNF